MPGCFFLNKDCFCCAAARVTDMDKNDAGIHSMKGESHGTVTGINLFRIK